VQKLIFFPLMGSTLLILPMAILAGAERVDFFIESSDMKNTNNQDRVAELASRHTRLRISITIPKNYVRASVL
jgi:hypothetical protein